MSIHDRRYCTCILGSDPIGIITCCNIGCTDFTFKFFGNLVCLHYLDKHRNFYKQIDLELIDLNNV